MLGVEGFLRLILEGLLLGGGGVYLQLGVGLIVGIFTVCHLALNVCLSFFLSIQIFVRCEIISQSSLDAFFPWQLNIY